MAKPILVANWKNRPASLFEAKSLINSLSKSRALFKKLALFIAPPACYFDTVSTRGKSFAGLASQDISHLSKGTSTGEITPEILKSFGVRLSIIGHSERRALGETSALVASKIKVALSAGITPLVCVGELTRDQDGEHFESLHNQISLSLRGLVKKSDALKIVLAYEPVWAIGKSVKESIDSSELSQTIIFIRKVLSDLFGRKIAERIPILYGGSVEPLNAETLMSDTGIRGFLVGHASLNAKSFQAIAQAVLN